MAPGLLHKILISGEIITRCYDDGVRVGHHADLPPRPELLTVRQLDAFRHVIHAGNMSAAGRSLGISQPAVSRLIRDLETALGLELFVRKGPKIAPTPAALQLLAEVDRVYLGLDHIRDYARLLRQFPQGRLRVASMAVLAQGFLAEVARDYSAREPGISLSVHSDASIEILNQLKRNEHHIGLCSAIGQVEPVLVEERLPSLPAVCILPRGHRLVDRSIIGPSDLQGEDFIALGKSSILRRQIAQIFSEAEVEPKIRHETLFSNTAFAMVRAGLGVSIVDPYCLIGGQQDQVVARRFEPDISYAFSMLVPETFWQIREVQSFRSALLGRFKAMQAN